MRLMLLVLAAGMAAATVWDPAERITNNTYSDFAYWSCQRRVTVDAAGRIHVVWHVMNSGLGTYKFQVYYKRFNPGSGWSADTMLSADLYAASTYCKYPSVAVDSSGRVFAVWAAGSTDAAEELIYVKSCVPDGSGNGGWEAASRVLSTSPPNVVKGCPTVSASPDGHAHATWLEGSGAPSVVYTSTPERQAPAARRLRAL